jgi:hypothetical protein
MSAIDRTHLLFRPNVQCLEDRDLPSFLPPVSYEVDSYPRAVAIADFNGDGNPDIAQGGYSSQIAIYFGDGSGAYGAPHKIGVTLSSYELVVSDVNLDGEPDILSGGGTRLQTFLGNGDGTFQGPIESVDGGASIAVADFNRDGKPDVAARNSYKSIVVLFGNGDGSFRSPLYHPVGLFANNVRAGDLNGDGWTDLTVDNRNTYDLSVLMNRGDGTFLPKVDYPVFDFPFGHALGDVNKDTRLDAVLANGSNITVLLGNGNGTFGPPQNFLTGVAAVSFPVLADFNRDRKLDVAATSPNSSTVSVLLGNGDGTFQPSTEYEIAYTETRGIAAGDLNQDRYPDIVVTKDKGPVFDVHAMVVLINDASWSIPLPSVDASRASATSVEIRQDLKRATGGPASIGVSHVSRAPDDRHAPPGTHRLLILRDSLFEDLLSVPHLGMELSKG